MKTTTPIKHILVTDEPEAMKSGLQTFRSFEVIVDALVKSGATNLCYDERIDGIRITKNGLYLRYGKK